MKNFIRYLFIVFFFLFIVGFISKGFPSLDFNSSNELEYGDEIITDNDDMLLDDGQFMLVLNQTAVQSYFNSNTYSSKTELEDLYSEFYDTHIEAENVNDVVDDKMKIYICLENENKQKMYLYGNAWFNESKEIVRMNFSWYNQTSIVEFMKTGSIVLGTTSKCFVGETLKVNSKSVLAMEGNFDGELKYFDLSNISNDIRKICDSLFTDLFAIRTSSSIGETNTDNNGNGEQNIDIAFLNMIYEGYPVWDTDSFGTELPYESIFNKLYSSDLEDEGAQEIQNALVLKYTYTNNSTLINKVFYLVIDSLLDYVGLSIYENNEYSLIWYRDDSKTYVSDTLYYDLTNYYCSEETTLLGKSIVYSETDNQMFHTIPLSKVLSGISEESDFPIYLGKFIGYDETNNYILEQKDIGEKYFLYDLVINRTLDVTSNEVGEIYYELDDNGNPTALNGGDYDLESSLTFEKGKIYIINAYTYINGNIEDQEMGYAFFNLYNISKNELINNGHYIIDYGCDLDEYYLGNMYEPSNDIENELGTIFEEAIMEKLGKANENGEYWCSIGSNIVIIPSEDFTLTLTSDLNLINEYLGLHLVIAESNYYFN